jgi:hypothetical protein
MKTNALQTGNKFHNKENFPITGILTKLFMQIKQSNLLIYNYIQIVAGRLNTLLK